MSLLASFHRAKGGTLILPTELYAGPDIKFFLSFLSLLFFLKKPKLYENFKTLFTVLFLALLISALHFHSKETNSLVRSEIQRGATMIKKS